MPREWNTPVRECWNAPIHNILKAIDNHTQLYLKTGDKWHIEQADFLRTYVSDLKTWIHAQEKYNNRAVDNPPIIDQRGNILREQTPNPPPPTPRGG